MEALVPYLRGVHIGAGGLALLVLEHADELSKAQATQVRSLIDAVNFVNWRRLEHGQSPVLTVAWPGATGWPA